MRKLALITALAAAMLAGGCRYDKTGAGDKPVSPNERSYEQSQNGEPQLPKITHWWED